MARLDGPGRDGAVLQGGIISLDGRAERLIIEDPRFLFTAKFERVGDNLVLTGADGQQIVIQGYFAGGELPVIWAANGARLTPETRCYGASHITRLGGCSSGRCRWMCQGRWRAWSRWRHLCL